MAKSFLDDPKYKTAVRDLASRSGVKISPQVYFVLLYPILAQSYAKSGDKAIQEVIPQAQATREQLLKAAPKANMDVLLNPESNYYQRLGISQNASDTERKSAFRAISKEIHPDYAPPNASAEEKAVRTIAFQNLNQANQTIKDEQLRQRYDERLRHEGTIVEPKYQQPTPAAPVYTGAPVNEAAGQEVGLYEGPEGGVADQLTGIGQEAAEKGLKGVGEKVGILKKSEEGTKALKEGGEALTAAKTAAGAGKAVLGAAKALATAGLTLLTDTLFNYAQRHKEVMPLAIGVGLMAGGVLVGGPIGALMFGAGALLTGSTILATIGAGGAGAAGGAIGSAGAALSNILTSAAVHVATGIGMPVLVAILVVLFAVPLILFIINTGAYIVPPYQNSFVTGTFESDYIEVTKIADRITFQNTDVTDSDGVTVGYTITVRARQGQLTNLSFTNNCQIVRDGARPTCNHPIPNPVPQSVSPTAPPTFDYEETYQGANFTDAFVVDTFTAAASVEVSPGNFSQEAASASPSVRIGNPPEDCPSGYPVNLPNIQSLYRRGACTIATHSAAEAIDIGMITGTPVNATHRGIVERASDYGLYGTTVEIRSTCQGVSFISRYSHLSAVAVAAGQQVGLGDNIGLSGNTGNSTGAHLHYEFRPSGSICLRTNPTVPYMAPTFYPDNVRFRYNN